MSFKAGDKVELFIPKTGDYEYLNEYFFKLYTMRLPMKGIVIQDDKEKITVNFAPFRHSNLTHNCNGTLNKSTGRFFYKNNSKIFNQFDNSQMIRMAEAQLEFNFC